MSSPQLYLSTLLRYCLLPSADSMAPTMNSSAKYMYSNRLNKYSKNSTPSVYLIPTHWLPQATTTSLIPMTLLYWSTVTKPVNESTIKSVKKSYTEELKKRPCECDQLRCLSQKNRKKSNAGN